MMIVVIIMVIILIIIIIMTLLIIIIMITRIQFGMECVRGPRKFQFIITTVTRMLGGNDGDDDLDDDDYDYNDLSRRYFEDFL